jgi:drug/metabolite transporter (DMT)-like permease
MVLTRRQEQLLHTPPPPAAGGRQADGEASPATPAGAVAATAQANGRALPLKSALKTGRKLRPSGPGEEESTPVDAGIKKRVRIHSSSNLVHEFTTSHSTDEARWALMGYEEEEEEEHESGSDGERGSADGTPDSGGVRRGRMRRRTAPAAPSFLSLLLFGDEARGRGGTRRGGRRRASSGAWLGVLYTLAWMAASSALIFVNKVIMVDHGFRFPFALTAMGQGASVLLALAASLLGFAPLRPPPSAEVAITKLLPVAASFAASLFLGNVAYLGLSVAFINMLKAATPLVTLAVGLALRLEAMSKLTLLSTALIAFGTAVATASEAGTTHFHWLSFLAFAGSVVFEGVRVVMTEKLLGQSRYNVMEALVYLGPFTTAFLAAGAFAFEWDQGLSTTVGAVMVGCDQLALVCIDLLAAGQHLAGTAGSSCMHRLQIVHHHPACLPAAGLGAAALPRRRLCHRHSHIVPGQPVLLPGNQARVRHQLQGGRLLEECAGGVGRHPAGRRGDVPRAAGAPWLHLVLRRLSVPPTHPGIDCSCHRVPALLPEYYSAPHLKLALPLLLQGYGISLAGFVLFSAARYRRPAGAGHSGDSNGRGPPKKR